MCKILGDCYLKGELSIDLTFYPPQFSLDSTFKRYVVKISDFEDVKLEVKRRAGLTVKSKDSEGKTLEMVKSFADCSKDQISMAIQSCIELGADFGCILY